MYFVAKVIYQIIIKGSKNNQFDEQLLIIKAQNVAEAYLKARAIGAEKQHEFINDRKNNVKWQMIDVADIMPVESPEHGSVVYSQVIEEDSESFIDYIKRKAMVLQTQSLLFA
ncbi:MAG: DUF4288 domain-containing protein [Bacteroidia bacterium]|nr:DUF4288 domain-containing protein [Bacteroidia bacterium]HCI59158.1 hypothetical protein [Bacteroidota bacterium]MCC7514683.1 DUF4288 domain-containing protein [Bacteroidia bacterium]HMU77961.1 DUF4288 domain-containing protein [Bacteroidia bacterium]HMW10949.1 DUF4288 domain-containing protein [Bacteroidia bacterium]